mgnify:CR=1 FL=1
MKRHSRDSQILEYEGRKVGLAEFGDLSGFPIFFFHGWPSSRLQGELNGASAERCGVRLICLDRPGIGLSDSVEQRRLEDWPPLVEFVAKELNLERYSALGVSGGGPYAVACAAACGEGLYKAMTVSGAVSLADPEEQKWLHPAYRHLLKLRRRFPWALGPALKMGKWVGTLPDEHWLVKRLVQEMAEPDRECLQELGLSFAEMSVAFCESMRQGTRGVITDSDIYLQDWPYDLGKIRNLLIWHGHDDVNLPIELAQSLAARAPHAEARYFENEGHYSLPLRRSDEILRELVP